MTSWFSIGGLFETVHFQNLMNFFFSKLMPRGQLKQIMRRCTQQLELVKHRD